MTLQESTSDAKNKKRFMSKTFLKTHNLKTLLLEFIAWIRKWLFNWKPSSGKLSSQAFNSIEPFIKTISIEYSLV